MGFGRIIGEVPHEYREQFSTPLPDDGGALAVQNHALARFGEEGFDEAKLASGLRHFAPIIREILELSGIKSTPSEQLQIVAVQGDAWFMGYSNGWHPEGYRKVVVSDRFGTVYESSPGEASTAKDYHYLLLDPDSLHRAQRISRGESRQRTVLHIEQIPK